MVHEKVSLAWVKPAINLMKTSPIIPLMSSCRGEICDCGEVQSEKSHNCSDLQRSESQALMLIVNVSPFLLALLWSDVSLSHLTRLLYGEAHRMWP